MNLERVPSSVSNDVSVETARFFRRFAYTASVARCAALAILNKDSKHLFP